MKKGIVRHNWIHYRKRIVTWTVLILILSLISLSAAESGNETDNHDSAGINQDSKIAPDKDTYNGETAGGSSEIETGTGSNIDNQGNAGENLEKRAGPNESAYSLESNEEDVEAETGTEKDTDSHESIEKSTEIETETKQDTGNQGNLEENPGAKTEIKQNTDNQQNIENNPDLRIREEKDIENQESVAKNLEIQTAAKDDASSQDSIQKDPETKIRSEKSTDNQKSTEKNLDIETGANKGKICQGSAVKSLETETRTEEDTDNQENIGKNLETGKSESWSTYNLGSSHKDPELKEETKEDPESQKSSEANLRLKASADNEKYGSGSPGKKTGMETGLCDGSKNLEIIKVKAEPEGEACRGIINFESSGLRSETEIEADTLEKNLKSDNAEAEIKVEGINWTYVPGTKELKPEIKPELWSSFPSERLWIKSGESSWNNLKFILSYPCSIRSFYTTHESVKIHYKGSEALKEQKVDIYLVKTCNSSFSEEAVTNVTDGNTTRFEDIFNKNTEFYVQIPATLNERGDMSPLTVGPLPEGSYWVLITLSGNETKSPEPEKTILLANYFEVLRYEMEAEAPHTIEEGKDFEVNLDLKNFPVQENCTYWAVLVREDACRTSMNISSETNGTKAVSGTFIQELRLLRDFGLNSTNYESETGKDKLKSKIETLIGQGNGTITIGEENQSILSLKSFGLAPGNYLLFAGSYEKEKGLAGMVQEKLTISPTREEDAYSKSYSDDYNFSGRISKEQKALLSGN